MTRPYQVLKWHQFGAQIVLRELSRKRRGRYFWVLCACGNERAACLTDLVDGVSLSCGCLPNTSRTIGPKPPEVRGAVWVPLTQGKFTLIDESDMGVLGARKWHAIKNKNRFYAVSSKPKFTQLHRAILDAKRGELVNHINGDGLDNRRSNIRVCTAGGNAHNQKLHSNNTSGFKGVQFSKSKQRWFSIIAQKICGYFRNPVDAALAYDRAAIEMFGDFAMTNKMLGLLPAHVAKENSK